MLPSTNCPTVGFERLKPLRVAKFGGTSVQDQAAIERVVAIVNELRPGMAVVLSAMGGVTDLLLGAADLAVKGADYKHLEATFRRRHHEAADALLKDPLGLGRMKALIDEASDELLAICQSLKTLKEATPRTLDLTASRGERMLAQLFAAVMSERGVDTLYVDATELIKVESQYGSPFPDLVQTQKNVEAKVRPHLEAGKLVIVPGFIGKGPDNELVTLGRGGSDLSATVLGHCLKAETVFLFKEVDGLLTADPKYVEEARIVPELHYREAAELAYYGAKVLHSRTIIPLLAHQIPLNVRNTFHPKLPGTRIAGDVSPGSFPVKALTAILNQSLITVEGKGMMGVPGIAARTFDTMAKAGISVSVISQASSEASICFVVPTTDAKAAAKALNETFRFEREHHLIDEVRALDKQAVLAVVGLGMKGTPGIASRTFAALARAKVNVEAIAQGSSELNISVVVDQERVAEGLSSLHREFRLEKLRALPQEAEGDVRLAFCGTGQIGRTLLKQVLGQHDYFKDKMRLDLKCVGLIDSSGLLVQEQGFARERLEDILLVKERGGKLFGEGAGRLGIARLQAEAKDKLWQLPVKKAVFIDMTADETAPLIKDALSAGWHVALANKKPLAVKQDAFDELFEIARQNGVFLRYEATVGAGLPILDTLSKLKEAGDEVKMILGCFSGTLGYLMTELEAGARFSEAVGRAHSLGYTEPDPREDLSGMDVARKALILARTLGIRLDLSDLVVESLFSPAASHDDPAVFLDRLKAEDAAWQAKVLAAKKDHKVLRYVARISHDKVSVGVEQVAADAPLGRLKGTDNQVTVSTRRYDKNPLIVSGPGAGAEVTAAGVLNDVIAIASAGDRPVELKRRKGKS